MSIFEDQTRFMRACGQTIDEFNALQVNLYHRLVDEEMRLELDEAMERLLGQGAPSVQNVAEVADACVDSIVVLIGLLRSMGLDPQPLWDEVMGANLAKIDAATGAVLKRSDGKVLKPSGWKPPHIGGIVREQLRGKIP